MNDSFYKDFFLITQKINALHTTQAVNKHIFTPSMVFNLWFISEETNHMCHFWSCAQGVKVWFLSLKMNLLGRQEIHEQTL